MISAIGLTLRKDLFNTPNHVSLLFLVYFRSKSIGRVKQSIGLPLRAEGSPYETSITESLILVVKRITSKSDIISEEGV